MVPVREQPVHEGGVPFSTAAGISAPDEMVDVKSNAPLRARFVHGPLAPRPNDDPDILHDRVATGINSRIADMERQGAVASGRRRSRRLAYFGQNSRLFGGTGKSEAYFSDINHPAEIRGENLESARAQYASEMGGRAWSDHAKRIFGTDRGTGPMSPMLDAVHPELSQFRNWRFTPKTSEDTTTIQDANRLQSTKKSFSLEELLSNPHLIVGDRTRLGDMNGSQPGQLTRHRTDPETGKAVRHQFGPLAGKAMSETAHPLGAVASLQHTFNALHEQMMHRLAHHEAFNASLKRDENGNIDEIHPDNVKVFNKQRSVVYDELSNLKSAMHEIAHGNGVVVTDPDDARSQRSGKTLTVRTQSGFPQAGHSSRAVLGVDGKIYAGHKVAVSAPAEGEHGLEREVYHPDRAVFDEKGRIANPKEAAFTSRERKDATVHGSYVAPLYISSLFRHLGSKINEHFDVAEGDTPEERETNGRIVSRVLGNTKINTGWRSMVENFNRPMNLVNDSSFPNYLTTKVAKEDPTLYKAIQDNVPDHRDAPGVGVTNNYIDQVIPQVIRRQRDSNTEAKLSDLRGRAEAMGGGKNRRRGVKTLLGVTKEIMERMLPGSTQGPQTGSIKRITQEHHDLLQKQLDVADTVGRDYYTQQMASGDVDWAGRGNDTARAEKDMHEYNKNRVRDFLDAKIVHPSELNESEREAAENATGLLGSQPYMPEHLRSFTKVLPTSTPKTFNSLMSDSSPMLPTSLLNSSEEPKKE